MKALTVKQPWAWAIIHGGKNIENRATLWKYRGPLAIHAGGSWSRQGGNDTRVADALGYEPYEPCNYGRALSQPGHQSGGFTFGAILGVVDLEDVHHANDGCCQPWGDPDYNGRPAVHLVLADPRPLAEPLPVRGSLGLWDCGTWEPDR